jgi:hypothetical protein
MFNFKETYTTPTAEQLSKLSTDTINRLDNYMESDCQYLLNLFNKALTESLKPSDRSSHYVDIDYGKLNVLVKLDQCEKTKYDLIGEMKNVGVTVEENKVWERKFISYNKLNKKLTCFW